MASEQKLDRFDRFLPADPWTNPWQDDGSYRVDYDLLVRLLTETTGTTQQSGIVAAATDVWAAEELRRAGFNEDEVWPRRTQPRILPRDIRNFVEGGALTQALRTEVEARYTHSKARRALPAEGHVLGSAYTKQADVLIASWAAGVELLISTKTMLSSYQKNMRNRFEEAYGDAKNIRGRHPLAALGFLFVVGADVPENGLEFIVDMLRKLVREPDVYECCCLIVTEGPQGSEDAADEERGPDDEPAALVPVLEGDDSDGPIDDPAVDENPEAAATTAVSLIDQLVPDDLAPGHFFESLIRTALDRMPVAVYPEVRVRLEEATSA
ncbi:MAG: hypothetical protein GEU79_17045 [Acidimicrobiia bacterium]|nr:hypothetical protein [Acidimicrobiia bacterium]